MKKNALMLCLLLGLPIFIFSQSRSIKGIVRDENKQPLSGATIAIFGADRGSRIISSGIGEFSLNAKETDSVMVTYTGYQQFGIRVGSLGFLEIDMVPSESALQEVVVSGYGITTARKRTTGATSKVDKESLENTVPLSVSDVIAGRAAGVNIVSNDGSPGAGISINIRGLSSITAGSEPLVVIDNIPYISSGGGGVNPLNSLNPNDIETIDILKDAAATALYGVGAANGVIVVTTKKGKLGKPSINLSIKSGWGELARTLKTLSPQEYALYRAERVRTFAGDDGNLANSARFPGRPSMWEILANLEGSRPWVGDPYSFLTNNYGVTNYTGTDWLDVITQTPTRNFYDLDFSGATDAGTSYFASVGYAAENGTLINSSFKRFSTRLNLDQKIGKVWSTGVRMQYSNTSYVGLIGDNRADNAISQANFLNPYINRDNVLGSSEGLINNGGAGAGPESPEFRIKNTDVNRGSNWFSGNMYLTAKPFSWLTATLQGGAITEDSYRDYYVPKELREAQNVNGRADITRGNVTRWVLQPRLAINKQFSNKQRLNATLAYEARKDVSKNIFTRYEQFNTDVLGVNSISSAQSIQSTPTFRDRRTQSYLGHVQYDFNSKYIITGSFRVDQSSKFVTNNTGTFPAISAAWNLKEENWMENMLSSVSTMRIRAGWGITGNDQIPDNSAIPLGSISTVGYPFNNAVNTPITINSRFANPDITWETTEGVNLGFDLGLFKDKVYLSSNYYVNNTTGLLLDVQLPSYSGFRSSIQNIGSLRNRGLEFEIASTNIKNRNFSWTSTFNIAFNKNEITDLGGNPELGFRAIGSGTSVNDVILRVGQSIGIYYGTIQSGVINNDFERYNSARKRQDNNTGEFDFYDINGDGIIDRDEYVPIAYTMPLHTGGFGNTLNYKGLELYLFLRWSYGNDIVNNNINRAHYLRGDNNLQSNLVNDIWTRQNQDRNYQSTNAIFTTRINSLFSRSEMVEDGSYLRFETLRLGYNLPKKWISKAKLKNAKLTFTGQNLFVLTRYSWYDPEVNTSNAVNAQLFPGLDQGAYPRSRWFIFGLDVSF